MHSPCSVTTLCDITRAILSANQMESLSNNQLQLGSSRFLLLLFCNCLGFDFTPLV